MEEVEELEICSLTLFPSLSHSASGAGTPRASSSFSHNEGLVNAWFSFHLVTCIQYSSSVLSPNLAVRSQLTLWSEKRTRLIEPLSAKEKTKIGDILGEWSVDLTKLNGLNSLWKYIFLYFPNAYPWSIRISVSGDLLQCILIKFPIDFKVQ